jgi:DNA (cytosine-5)-methyltransferase 1
VVSRDKFGLVVVGGLNYQIADIGMRMLEPRELFNAQEFPPDYIIDKDFTGKQYPKAAQVAMCGNAVPPVFAEALTRVNLNRTEIIKQLI